MSALEDRWRKAGLDERTIRRKRLVLQRRARRIAAHQRLADRMARQAKHRWN